MVWQARSHKGGVTRLRHLRIRRLEAIHPYRSHTTPCKIRISGPVTPLLGVLIRKIDSLSFVGFRSCWRDSPRPSAELTRVLPQIPAALQKPTMPSQREWPHEHTTLVLDYIDEFGDTLATPGPRRIRVTRHYESF